MQLSNVDLMIKEEKLSKTLYKLELYLIKTTPIIMSCVCLSNTILSYNGIDLTILSYIGGTSLLELMFLYLSSYVFKFCIYHRLPIHYLSINWIINVIDEYIGIPIANKPLLILYVIIAGITILLMLYFKFKLKWNICKQ